MKFSMRGSMTLLFRTLDRKNVFLGLGLGFGIINGAENLSESIEFPDWLTKGLFITSVLFGGLYSAAELSKKFNIWRFFPPEYRGFPELKDLKAGSRLHGQYELIYGENSPLRKFVFLRSDKVIVIDALGLLNSQLKLLNRLVFPGQDEALNRIAAQINLRAFSGTLYGTNLEDKLTRNRAISAKNRTAFALLRHKDDERLYVGLTSVLPLDTAGATAYTTGLLSDNDVGEDVVASPDEPLGALLLFMIAHKPTFADETSRKNLNSLTVIEDLIMATILQVVIFTVLSNESRPLMIAGAYGAKIVTLLKVLGLGESKTLKSADGLIMFANKIMINDKENVRNWLSKNAAHILHEPSSQQVLRPLSAAHTLTP